MHVPRPRPPTSLWDESSEGPRDPAQKRAEARRRRDFRTSREIGQVRSDGDSDHVFRRDCGPQDRTVCAPLVPARRVVRVQPRMGRHRVAQGASPGSSTLHRSPSPVGATPEPADDVAPTGLRFRGRPSTQGSRPGLHNFAPYGAEHVLRPGLHNFPHAGAKHLLRPELRDFASIRRSTRTLHGDEYLISQNRTHRPDRKTSNGRLRVARSARFGDDPARGRSTPAPPYRGERLREAEDESSRTA